GNIILGENKFREDFSSESVTENCQEGLVEVHGKKIKLIDTPGLCDTRMGDSVLKKKIENLFNYAGNGLHVILLVIKLGDRFTQEDQNTVKWIQENFGEEVSKYTMVLFTHGDLLKETIDDYVRKGEQIKSLVDQCRGGYHVFSTNILKYPNQVTELLRKIEKLKEENQNKGYVKKIYEETQKNLTLK
uniref:GTPase IMAP family member 8 n=1 Tax=Sinocyclocheilus anshuiensis TaxID=1608454 RepID=A0A671MU53_9TELE